MLQQHHHPDSLLLAFRDLFAFLFCYVPFHLRTFLRCRRGIRVQQREQSLLLCGGGSLLLTTKKQGPEGQRRISSSCTPEAQKTQRHKEATFWENGQSDTHTHTHTHPHARAHTHTHTHTPARAPTHTHTHTHSARTQKTKKRLTDISKSN